MKRDVLLLVDADADTVNVVVSIAALTKFDVRFAQTSRDFFPLTQDGLADVALIVLDTDPGVHGLGVLEAVGAWGPAPPIIVISSDDEADLHPVVIAHGATERLEKPVSIDRLKTAIEKFVHAPEETHCRCDVWGHPCADCTNHRSAPHEREIASLAEKT